jgi:hypothetical protein
VLPVRSPNLNAYSERWVRSVKEECLSKVLLIGERSLRLAVSEYVAHYHAELGVTARPNAEWLARQLTEACGWDEPPRYLIRDRDSAYGAAFIRRIRAMGYSRPTGLGAVALAERICGEADRLDPTGMS